MSDLDSLGRQESSTIEVRVYRDGSLVHTELCESEVEAMDVVDEWSEQPGVLCEVDDLSVRHRAEDVFAPEPPDLPADYPTLDEQG
jgi:hypothetical protein